MKKDYYNIFCHNDLDGVSSILLFNWFFPDSFIKYESVSNNNIINSLVNFYTNSINVKNLWVLDISLNEKLKSFDSENLTIVDHHKRSEDFLKDFKKSNIIYKEYTSTIKLLYKIFKKIENKNLSENQKRLILLVDDYDSGFLNFNDSYDLNILYRKEYKNDSSNFIKDFSNGFNGFTNKQNKLIIETKIKAVKTLKSYELYQGEIFFSDRNLNCIATFGDNPDIIAIDLLVKEKLPDLFFYINLEKNKVIIKQPKLQNSIDLNLFCRKYCDGNGNNKIGGGKITEMFLELTKNFKKI